jgi:O-acetyl-ADP-ribose deacetylase (regulator of RNase III)
VIEVLEADITSLDVDAIANAANAQLLHGGGVAGAIARAAGPELERESRAKAPIAVGDAIETTGGDLPARWVIHAATMATPGGTTDADTVRRCTAATLWKAEELACRSLALVAFGTGVGGFPVSEAASIEVDEVTRHLSSGSRLERVVFAVRGAEALSAFEHALSRHRDMS